jgi:hypothetical protein
MKSAKTLVSAILIPALMVASGGGADDSVQKLLRKPRFGVARIDFADGTQAAGTVSRVTTQFLTLHETSTCRNVEVAQIASVKWYPNQGDSLGFKDIGLMVISSPIWIPWVVASALEDRDETSPLDGDWESISTPPDGKISRIKPRRGNLWVTGGFDEYRRVRPLRFVRSTPRCQN